jgi:hypothetical protein
MPPDSSRDGLTPWATSSQHAAVRIMSGGRPGTHTLQSYGDEPLDVCLAR